MSSASSSRRASSTNVSVTNEEDQQGGNSNVISLPEGWDVGRDFDGKVYFIDHNARRTTWQDPRTTRHRMSREGNGRDR